MVLGVPLEHEWLVQRGRQVGAILAFFNRVHLKSPAPADGWGGSADYIHN
jgi:hypothetical protein